MIDLCVRYMQLSEISDVTVITHHKHLRFKPTEFNKS